MDMEKTTAQKIKALKKDIAFITATMYGKPNYKDLVDKRCEMYAELSKLQFKRKAERNLI